MVAHVLKCFGCGPHRLGDLWIDRRIHQGRGREGQLQRPGRAVQVGGVGVRRAGNDERIAGLGHGQVVEHGCRVANGLGPDEAHGHAVAPFVVIGA